MSWQTKGRPVGMEIVHTTPKRMMGRECWWGGKRTGDPYRSPCLMSELRRHEEFGRGKRSPNRLAGLWEDCVKSPQRSWKAHRRTKYRPLLAG